MFKLRNKLSQLPRIAWFLLHLVLDPVFARLFSKPRREQAVLDYVREHAQAGDPDSVLRTMDEFARGHGWLMNVGPEKGDILERALAGENITRVLEIGAYCGYSAVLIGRILQRGSGTLVSVEKSRRCAAIAGQVVEHAGLADTVSFRQGVLAGHIEDFDQPFDAIFLDHWKDEYLPDLKRLEAAGLLRQGTVVVADNIEFFDVPDYLAYVRECGAYSSTFHKASVEYNEGIDDGVEVSVYRGQETPPEAAKATGQAA
jgi:catechol O-methyltransferase